MTDPDKSSEHRSAEDCAKTDDTGGKLSTTEETHTDAPISIIGNSAASATATTVSGAMGASIGAATASGIGAVAAAVVGAPVLLALSPVVGAIVGAFFVAKWLAKNDD
jgi:hypothetical protein